MEEKNVKANRPFRTIRIIFNILLLLITVIVVLQNAQAVTINFLNFKFDISLALLVFLTGSVGSVITLFFLLFKK